MESSTVEIRTEWRGLHGVAWMVAADGATPPSVLMVGQTEAEAEDRLRRWWESRCSEAKRRDLSPAPGTVARVN
jgi:hypothetical protein